MAGASFANAACTGADFADAEGWRDADWHNVTGPLARLAPGMSKYGSFG